MTDYDIRYEPLFRTLEKMNVQALIDAVQEPWYNQTLLQVGDVVVRLGVMQGEFHWHKHDEQDEFFFVLDGVFRIELEGRRGGGAASSRSLQRPCRNVAPTSRPGT
jgi:oxalate decarboxylase/phosphoglucose isomerase-like protein (cupin superfamily)